MTLIIAEAGVNHNGNEQLAFDLVDAAANAGADIVKFQTFKAKKLVTETAKQADYQITNTGKIESQLEMLTRLELSFESHIKLVKHCSKIGIEFLSTAFDEESLDFLVNTLGLSTLKLPSGELTNAPLVLCHARTDCDIIVSTGMASLSEIETALGIIAFGYLNKTNDMPTKQDFLKAYSSNEGQILLRKKVTILHCTTEYPAPMEEINLKAMDTLGISFGLRAGYSDHSEGIIIPIAAVARGAVLIEKHFTLDKEMEGPDHKASLNPVELSEMVKAIRMVEKGLGNGIKLPTVSEIKNKEIARKSLVAIKKIEAGQVFSRQNIDVKRPGNGVSPINYWDYLGKKATVSYQPGDTIFE